MTAEVIPMPPPKKPLPRSPLVQEMMLAYGEALLHRTSDPLRSAFFAGLGAGYLVAFGFQTREPLDRARAVPGASCVHIDFRTARRGDDETVLHACGVRYGYYLGTSEQADAEDCAACGERLCTDSDDYEWCDDGWFCGDGSDCSRIWHQNGPAVCRLEGGE